MSVRFPTHVGQQSSTPSRTEEGTHEDSAELRKIQDQEGKQGEVVELVSDDNKCEHLFTLGTYIMQVLCVLVLYLPRYSHSSKFIYYLSPFLPSPTLLSAPFTDERTIYVYDKAPHDPNSNTRHLLAKEEGDAKLKTVEEESELSIATVRRENCVRVYIIFQESMEWLKAHCHQAWEFVRDFQVRPLPSNLLSKVVLIRVFETNDRVAEFIEGPLLVVNFHKEKWLNQPKECASLIGSKVHIHKQISNDIDGNSSQGCSPPSDRVLTPTNPPPEYSHPPPQEVHFEVPNGDSADLMGALKGISNELTAIRKATEKTAENTGRAADNTEGLAQTVEETRDITAHMGNEMQDKMVDEEVPNES